MRAVWFATALGLAAAACDRGHPREQPSKPASPAVPPAPPAAAAPGGSGARAAEGAACTLPELPPRRPMPRRLVAIGDLHGDLAAARSAL
ncbi:MAG TPA: calcineurin, partial [Kofleriaceae bacterium]|nr:calcineurin [Kofleriaceae bacterium]